MAISSENTENLEQALQVIAGASKRKLEARQKVLDYKDQLREARRVERMNRLGY